MAHDEKPERDFFFKVLIRAEVDPQTHSAHSLRHALALATSLSRCGIEVSFAMTRHSSQRFEGLGLAWPVHRLGSSLPVQLDRLSALQRKVQFHAILIHVPRLSAHALFEIRRRFPFCVVVDDGTHGMIHADVIVHPGFQAQASNLRCRADTKLMLGPRYNVFPRYVSRTEPKGILLAASCVTPSLNRLVSIVRQMGLEAATHACVDYPVDSPEPGIPVQVLGAEPGWGVGACHIICDASHLCLELAAQPAYFVNFPSTSQQLNLAYALDHLGVSPTLGSLDAYEDEEIESRLRAWWLDPHQAERCRETCRKWVDGRSGERLSALFFRFYRDVGEGLREEPGLE